MSGRSVNLTTLFLGRLRPPNREPDKLRIFVNYALKSPEYECLSNFNRITYCCHFSAYARGFVLFRTYESRSGDAEFGH